MVMSTNEYIFNQSKDQSELERLQLLESIFDPHTIDLLKKTGGFAGKHCLEVGAGAGSIMRWLSDEVGAEGQVTAVDLNDRFLKDNTANVEVMIGDIQEMKLPAQSFDLIHVRYVLIHIPEGCYLIEKLWKLLKPGGHLVIEEPDFSIRKPIVSSLKETLQGFQNIHLACDHLFFDGEMDAGFGTSMISWIQELIPHSIEVVNNSPVTQGGTDLARMMNLSAQQLKAAYLSTGKVTEADFELYRQFTEDPLSWAIYYATIGVIAQH